MNDDSLDALAVSGEHHRLLLEDDHIRVLETLIPPGERTAVHTHAWAGVLYILSWSDFVRYDADGTVLLDSRVQGSRPANGAAVFVDRLEPHSFHNVGTEEFRVIAIEIKQHKA